jgi:hypothetical protein
MVSDRAATRDLSPLGEARFGLKEVLVEKSIKKIAAFRKALWGQLRDGVSSPQN